MGPSEIESLKRAFDYREDRKDIRILAWDNHCNLIKNIDVLLERPIDSYEKMRHCDRCVHWYISVVVYKNRECSQVITPQIVCSKKKRCHE